MESSAEGAIRDTFRSVSVAGVWDASNRLRDGRFHLWEFQLPVLETRSHRYGPIICESSGYLLGPMGFSITRIRIHLGSLFASAARMTRASVPGNPAVSSAGSNLVIGFSSWGVKVGQLSDSIGPIRELRPNQKP